jgi:hypothetical protein
MSVTLLLDDDVGISRAACLQVGGGPEIGASQHIGSPT